MTDIKISVLTSLYRHKYIYVNQCLESLRLQTLRECEFILIDNGANDENKQLINDYVRKDPRFRSISLEKNIGTGAALNIGLGASRGEYIGFLESDDFADRNMYLDLYNKTNGGKIDVVKSLFQTLDERGVIKLAKNFPDMQCNKILKLHECRFLIRGHVSHWSGIYKKEFLNKNKINFNETLGAHSQDFGFMILVYAFAKSVYIVPRSYVTYRLYSGVHEMKYMNAAILDECELTFSRLCRTDISEEFWNGVYVVVGPRLKICYKDALPRDKRRIEIIIRKIEKKQNYKYFNEKLKIEMKEFLHQLTVQKILALLTIIIRIEQKEDCTTISLLGLPFAIIAKKDTAQEKYFKLFGIPIYWQRDTQYDIRAQLDTICKQLLSVKDALQEQGKINRVVNTKLSNIKSLADAQYVHPHSFKKYKGAFSGKEVVLVGTGPSIIYYPPERRNERIYVGVNGAIYLKNIILDYLFVQDYTIYQKGNETLVDDALTYEGRNCKKFFGILPDSKLIPLRGQIARIPLRYTFPSNVNQYVLEDWELHNIAYDLSYQPMGQFKGTMFSALQFVLFAHPARLYLVGWDCGKGYAYGKQNAGMTAEYQVDILRRYFVPFINLNYPDIEIISINPVGLKGIFKDVYTESYQVTHPEE